MKRDTRSHRAASSSRRLFVERLEARTLLATFTVNSTVDAVDANPGSGTAETSGGQVTLRSAIQEANALWGASTIILPAGTYTLTLPGVNEDNSATGDLDIRGNLTITGAGSGTTIVDGGGIDRVFDVLPGAVASIAGITVQGGSIAAVSKNGGFGGGILNDGDLTLNGCLVQDNNSGAGSGGGIANGDFTLSDGGMLNLIDTVVRNNGASFGGGIDNPGGTLSLVGSTVDGNTALLGAGIRSGVQGEEPPTDASLSLISSTVSRNQVVYPNFTIDHGSGVLDYGNLTVINSTISDNSEDGIDIDGPAGGEFLIESSTIADNGEQGYGSAVPITMSDTIVAGNQNFGVGGQTVISPGYNLIQDGPSSSFPGNIGVNNPSVDLLLGPLADNGGPTQTQLLLSGSPAIDAGNPAGETDASGNPLTTDQRGQPRTVGAAIDIGAVEDPAPGSLLASRTTVVSSANPVEFDNAITLTATVTPAGPSGPVAKGAVLFLDGTTVLGSGLVSGSGIATFMTAPFEPGFHAITAEFVGDGTYAGSLSAPLSEEVDPAVLGPTTTTVVTDAPRASNLQDVTFTAAVSSLEGGTPSGTVTFQIDGTSQSPVPLDAVNGVVQAVFSTAHLAPGSHTIGATYNGDLSFAPSFATSPVMYQTVGPVVAIPTDVTFVSSANASTVGQSVTFTATASVTSQPDTTPTGTVQFQVDGTLLAPVPLMVAAGQVQALFSTAGLSAGMHQVEAHISLDAPFSLPQSDLPDFVVNQAVDLLPTQTNLSVTPESSASGQTVMLTANVAGSPSGGSVVFLDDNVGFAAVPIDASGQAVLPYASLPPGAHTITAIYAGTSTFAASASNAVTETVAQPIPPAPPSVVSLKRLGLLTQSTELALNFDKTLDPVSAQNPANYQLVQLGRGRQPSRTVPLLSAGYNPVTNLVTLIPTPRLSPQSQYVLTVVGTAPGGVRSETGQLLDGDGDGLPGGNFVEEFGVNALSGPSRLPAAPARLPRSVSTLKAKAVDVLASRGALRLGKLSLRPRQG